MFGIIGCCCVSKEIKLGLLDCAKMEFLGIFWVLRGHATTLFKQSRGPLAQNWPRMVLYNFMSNMSRHWFSLQRHAAALNKGFFTDCVFGSFWLCFGSGFVLGLWYLDFKLGIDIVWV